MGKLNVIIQDSVDKKFREEVFKRKGMKKGNLTEALEEAMQLWVNADVMQSLKQKAMKAGTTITERKDIIETMKTMGRWATPNLGDLLKVDSLTITETKAINEAIRQLQA